MNLAFDTFILVKLTSSTANILNDKQIKALTSIQTLINHITEELQDIFARDESEDIWDPYIRVTSYIDKGKNHILFQVLKDIPE